MRLSAGESRVVGEAAKREGLSLGAWVGQVAVRSALGQADPLPATWLELVSELLRFRTDVSRAIDLIHEIRSPDSAARPAELGAGDLTAVAGELLDRVDVATAAAVAASRPRGRRQRFAR